MIDLSCATRFALIKIVVAMTQTKTAMTIADIMSRDPECVAPDTSLMEIRQLLHHRGFHHLLVVEDEKLVGVISDRDVLRTISPFLDTRSETPRDVRTLAKQASDLMRDDPVQVTPDMTVQDAASLLLDHSISCLPVVADGAVVGIVTTKDMLEYYRSREM
ncbi:CBS domain-containing protein [Longibacter salinarum]|uniref:CBS domain-containing protein n=1 Tax=Longibacter salinarum TaxID=1850348 RepID=A0A2A8CY08_9BACT|nr:CBS domain-containing protein [Longibacter salinarum]PEN13268.1 CBS domain-containing protein [Longibacter salinarum]